VKRPVLFNGIPTDLTRRPDLASRVIKLGIPPIKRRRTDLDLEEDFKRVWPEVLGALLDGLVGALRDWRKIDVEQGRGLRPARLMDFEKSAEAGCRAMGFREWEFVDAYYANRNGMMIAAVEASAVGRVVTTFIEKNPEGFAGQMTVLYNKLESYKPANLTIHDWPKTPSKLSTELRRLMQPLEAIGIVCAVEVDRRDVGGTQVDVVLAKDRKNRGKKV
jgi:hypothetical protein